MADRKRLHKRAWKSLEAADTSDVPPENAIIDSRFSESCLLPALGSLSFSLPLDLLATINIPLPYNEDSLST